MLPQFIVSLCIVFVYIYLKSKKAFHILQQNWYNDGNRYVKWIINNKEKLFVTPDILFLIFIIGMWISPKIEMSLFIIFYMVVALLYIKKTKKEQVKNHLSLQAE